MIHVYMNDKKGDPAGQEEGENPDIHLATT
jgi:hypothetical protein